MDGQEERSGGAIFEAWLSPPGTPEQALKVAGALSQWMPGFVPDSLAGMAHIAIDNKSGDIACSVAQEMRLISGEEIPDEMAADWMDASRSWLWAAACLGSSRAMIILVQEISRHADLPQPRRNAAFLGMLSMRWMSLAPALLAQPDSPRATVHVPGRRVLGRSVPAQAKGEPVTMSRSERQAVLAAARALIEISDETEVAHDPDAESFRAAEEAPAEGITVIRAIGDPNSREGADLRNRYKNIIGKPVGFSGRQTAPGEIRRLIAAKWPWAAEAADFFEGCLAMHRSFGSARVRLKPFLLVGPHGTGKTTLAEEIFKLVGIPSWTIPCSGGIDNAGMTATNRGWQQFKPCAPVRLMSEAGCANPAIILDELEKGTTFASQNGSIHGALMTMMASADHYMDGALLAPADLSYVSFAATANSLSGIPEGVLQRFEGVILVPRPLPEHFDICLDAIRRKEAASHGVSDEMMPWLRPVERDVLRGIFIKSGQSLRHLAAAYRRLCGAIAVADEMEAKVLN